LIFLRKDSFSASFSNHHLLSNTLTSLSVPAFRMSTSPIFGTGISIGKNFSKHRLPKLFRFPEINSTSISFSAAQTKVRLGSCEMPLMTFNNAAIHLLPCGPVHLIELPRVSANAVRLSANSQYRPFECLQVAGLPPLSAFARCCAGQFVGSRRSQNRSSGEGHGSEGNASDLGGSRTHRAGRRATQPNRRQHC
jgi:hypothetical protein